jgi:hypothetical protein
MAALALGCALPAFGAGERLTAKCNSDFGNGEVLIQASAQTRAAITAIVANPALDPEAYHALWRPSSSRILDYVASEDQVVLQFDQVQDTVQIAASIAADASLAALGVLGAFANSTAICFSPMPPTPRILVTEYHNQVLDHYFLSSSEVENAAIDSGAAGPGWSRTGEVFAAIAPGYCYSSFPVQRFYTYGANTHFFTVDAHECGFLRREDPGWIHEGEAFGARMPENGACPAPYTALYRLYNNRWMFNDSNHRFVSRLGLYEQMRQRGWIGEGVAMCLDPTGVVF